MSRARLHAVLHHPLRFVLQVVREFRANQGFLLASGVAYNTLLSVVPMFAVIIVALSHVTDQATLLNTTRSYLELIAPGQAQEMVQQLDGFLKNRHVVGAIGFLSLVFFSSFAFTMLENAMSVIFYHRVRIHRRHFAISAVIPYIYILLLALGLLIVSVVTGALDTLGARAVHVFGMQLSLDQTTAVVVYLLGLAGEVLLLTSLYLVMPVGRIALSHALFGGITAAILWEITRRVLAWYFATLSYVNVIYGSFTTVIVILLSLEIGAVILLLGAQVIAVYERGEEPEEPELRTGA